MSWRVIPFSAKSAMISPTTLTNLKPCPEQGEANETCSYSGVNVDYEVVIWGVGEHAGGEAHRWSGTVREVALRKLPQKLLVVVMGLSVDLIRRTGFLQVEVLAELEARHPKYWKAVEASFVYQQVKHREVALSETFGTCRLEPCQNLTLWHGEPI